MATEKRADVYLGGPATIDLLVAELSGLRAGKARELAAGVVSLAPGALVDPAFARQVLPGAREASGKSASELAGAILDGAGLVPDLEVTVPELERRGSRALEQHPLAGAEAELVNLLGKKVAGRAVKHGEARVPGVRLRVLLLEPWHAWWCLTPVRDVPPLLAWPSPFPGGRALGEAPRDAPSSAHRKLDEALAWLGVHPREHDLVLDLGAAPGGWSSVALGYGARVVAVDRAALDAKVAAHPRLTHVKQDAFGYLPEETPTWLLCDVIAEPARSFELARRALESPALHALVVTLKLKRPAKLEVVRAARALARDTSGWLGRCKQLVANKLEVTLLMRRADLAT
ncbi:MAG: hypothetical protein HYS27_00430 [Deltaproteobacteria bacterium]|nr:hypothetical protein [Deltaproteobacteria bacterium]